MADIRLIVSDLDGTILGPTNGKKDYAVLAQKLKLLGVAGVIWAVNTGRSVSSFRRVFRPLAALGIAPDFIIVRHAYVFSSRRWGYLPHVVWNLKICLDIVLTRIRTRLTIRSFIRAVREKFSDVRIRRLGRYKVAFRFRDSESMDLAYHLLRVRSQTQRNILVAEYVTELVVSTVPSTKGLAVHHLAQHLGIHRENILCIGDGHNDLSMLDGTPAAMTACPANATSEVMLTVHRSMGHIAKNPTLAGTIESIEAHQSGAVNNKLPQNILRLHESERENAARDRSPHRSSTELSFLRDLIIVGSGFVAVILTLASCRMLGPLSKYLMMPVNKAAEIVFRLTAGMF